MERWLAVADLYFGYELSQRAAGRLVPLWGKTSIEERLAELLPDYRPRRLIIVGDLMRDEASAEAAIALLSRLRERREVITLAGNHDQLVADAIAFVPRWGRHRILFFSTEIPRRMRPPGASKSSATITRPQA